MGLEVRWCKDPDIWLCHQCSDCTVYCPRGAKPGEVLGALRKMCIEEYAQPPQLAKMVSDCRYLPVLIAFPVLLLLAALKVTGYLHLPEGEIAYSKLFPTLLIDVIFVPAFFFALAVLGLGVMRYWKDLNASNPWKVKVEGNLVGNLIETLKDIVLHNRFRLCETTYNRSTNHLFLVFGFIFLAIVTGWGFLNEWVLHVESPYFIFSPIKLLAMVGTAGLLYGIYNILKERQANAEKAGYGSYYDWLLIYVIFAVGATGLLSWLFRLVRHPRSWPIPLTSCTCASVFFLFFYAPYTKMAHMVYRTTAMLWARMSGRGF